MSRVRFTNGYSDPETRRVMHGPEHSWPDTPLPKIAYVEPEPEPLNGETVAILKCYRAYNRELADKLLAHLSEWGLEAQKADWAKLKRDRTVAPGQGWNLSPGGLMTAQRIAKELALKVGIKHSLYSWNVIPGSSARVSCICGKSFHRWGTRNGESSAWAAASKHIADFEEFGDGAIASPPSSLAQGRDVVAGTDGVRQ